MASSAWLGKNSMRRRRSRNGTQNTGVVSERRMECSRRRWGGVGEPSRVLAQRGLEMPWRRGLRRGGLRGGERRARSERRGAQGEEKRWLGKWRRDRQELEAPGEVGEGELSQQPAGAGSTSPMATLDPRKVSVRIGIILPFFPLRTSSTNRLFPSSFLRCTRVLLRPPLPRHETTRARLRASSQGVQGNNRTGSRPRTLPSTGSFMSTHHCRL